MTRNLGFPALTAVVLVAALMLIPSASASNDRSGQGAFLIFAWSEDCSTVGNVQTCTVDFTGPIYGSLSGTFHRLGTITDTIQSYGPPMIVDRVITGTLTCDPCTVAGVDGTLTFAATAHLNHYRVGSAFTVALTFSFATGDLQSLIADGAGVYNTCPYTPTQNYHIQLEFV